MSNNRYNDDEDNKTFLPAWVAYEDEKARSKENKPLYSDDEIAEGEALLTKVQGAFPRCKAYLNIRQNFLAVSVKPITVRERITPQYTEMMEYASKENIKIAKLKSSIVFRKYFKRKGAA